MTDREQANAAAEALLAAARAEQQKAAERNTRPLVRLYPALARVPAVERLTRLREAREYADEHAVARGLMMLVFIATAALIAMVITKHADKTGVTAWIVVGTFFARQTIAQWLMRKYLRGLPETGAGRS